MRTIQPGNRWRRQTPGEQVKTGDASPPASITLTRRGIFILPTREGLLLGGVLMTMLVASINNDNSLGFLLTFLLTGLALVSMLHTYRNMVQLICRAGESEAVFVGEQAPFTLLLDNPARTSRFALTLCLDDDGVPTHVDVPAQSVTRVVVTRPATQRGYVPMGRCTVSTCFPVGIFRAWAYIHFPLQGVAYPLPAPPCPLPPLHLSEQSQGEGGGSGAADFVGLRGYVPGDSPRHVAWKQSARGGQLLTKLFAGEGQLQRWLNWDEVPSGDLETRLALMCRWVLSAHAAGLPYGLRMPARELVPTWSVAHRAACLKTLALYGIE